MIHEFMSRHDVVASQCSSLYLLEYVGVLLAKVNIIGVPLAVEVLQLAAFARASRSP